MKEHKTFLAVLILLLLPGGVSAQQPTEWEAYKSRFLSPDGRVIDFLQGQISHSEGQGYGLLLALQHDDPKLFSLLRKWAQDNLQVRKGDSLHAWKWGLRPNGQWTVLDYNNATDGDILIALALLKAAKKWKDEVYRSQALPVIRSIREHLIVKRQNHLYVLPGYYGFSQKGYEIINPSYLVFPGFKEFSEVEDPKFWNKVYEDSLGLLKKSTYGRLGLPADWIKVTESGISIHAEKSRYFGYDAIRTFLYLSWDGNLSVLPGVKGLLDIYRKLGYMPLNVDLTINHISLEEAPGGYYALYSRVAKDLGETELSRSLFQKAQKKVQGEKDDYYSHTLFLLSQGSLKP